LYSLPYIIVSILLIGTNATLYGIWNTTAGDDSTPLTSGLGIENDVPN
jgi:hypothetical protein